MSSTAVASLFRISSLDLCIWNRTRISWSLLIVFFVSLLSQGLSFRAVRMLASDKEPDALLYLSKRSDSLHGCYRHCQECRNIFGYMNYDYVSCAVACQRSRGDNWDGQCDGFRKAIKRTPAQQQLIRVCRQSCRTMEGGEDCRRGRPFHKLLATLMCFHYCDVMKFQRASDMNCTTARRMDEGVFRMLE